MSGARTIRCAAWLWGIAVMAALYASTLAFSESLDLYGGSRPAVRFLKILADVALLMSPYWFLPVRRRCLALVPLWCMGLLYFADAVYYRFAGDCMPLSSLWQVSNVDAPLAGSVLSLLRGADVLFFVPAAAASALWCVRPLRRAVASAPAFRWTVRLAVAGATLVIIVCAQVAHSRSYERMFLFSDNRVMTLFESTRERLVWRQSEFRCRHDASLRQSGVAVYMLTEVYDTVTRASSIKLSNKERGIIDAYVDRDAYAVGSAGKNLLMIVVESLNASAVDSIRTPVLDSLIHAPGSLSCLNVRPQVRQGISSDGQLLYNTGLMPLRGEVAVQRAVPFGDMPTLARQLSATHRPVALFADNGRTWRKKEVYRLYGFDTVLTSVDADRHFSVDSLGADDAAMRFAAAVCDTLQEPFFMQLLTISMHYPFGEAAAGVEGVDDAEERYGMCVEYFDRSLGRLMDSLREKGLLERTMVVVVSDHHINAGSGLNPEHPIVFVAANCGVSRRIDRDMRQADVFPTLLDLMGVRGKWRGVGHSVFGPSYGETERQWTVSDTILRSDYFRP